MHKFTLSNSFHNTEIRVLSPYRDGEISQFEVWQDLQQAADSEYHAGKARRICNRVRRALCGMSDCECGTVR